METHRPNPQDLEDLPPAMLDRQPEKRRPTPAPNFGSDSKRAIAMHDAMRKEAAGKDTARSKIAEAKPRGKSATNVRGAKIGEIPSGERQFTHKSSLGPKESYPKPQSKQAEEEKSFWGKLKFWER